LPGNKAGALVVETMMFARITDMVYQRDWALRFDCARYRQSALRRLRLLRLRAVTSGTAPTDPPGDRLGASLQNWS
jgi:hypothetical protein